MLGLFKWEVSPKNIKECDGLVVFPMRQDDILMSLILMGHHVPNPSWFKGIFKITPNFS